jgi:acetoin utilization protein AcuB
MTSNLATELPETPIKVIKEKMKVVGAHHIPIVQNFKLIGLISDRDLLKIDQSSTFYFLKAFDIMTTVLVVCDEDTPIEHLAKVLLEEKISCLPVVDKNHKLTGLITRSDLLRVIIENRLVLN